MQQTMQLASSISTSKDHQNSPVCAKVRARIHRLEHNTVAQKKSIQTSHAEADVQCYLCIIYVTCCRHLEEEDDQSPKCRSLRKFEIDFVELIRI